jgi:hypothetical protein
MSRTSPFPPVALEEALLIAKSIREHNAGKPMRRLTIFDILGKSPESSTSRSLITASSGYGLTEGSYASEIISLKERGQAIVERNESQAKIDAVLGVPVFAKFFENYRNSIVPSTVAAIDFLKECGLTDQNTQTCLDVLLKSGEQVALIQEISGSKRVVSPEHALEKLEQLSGDSGVVSSKNESDKSDLSVQSSIPKTNASPTSIQSGQLPNVHIDIQIHISADAKPEQIEQIFASMAKHLYNKH